MKTFFPRSIFLTLFIFLSTINYSQTIDTISNIRKEPGVHLFKTVKTIEIITGINFQSSDYNGSTDTRRYFELGIARSIHDYGRHGPVSLGVYISEEVYFGNKNIYGTKIGVYTHYFFDIGMSLIYYTDFNKANLKLRPEFGVGIGSIRIVGGYNVPTINNKAFQELTKSKGQLTIQVLLPAKKKMLQMNVLVSKSFFLNHYNRFMPSIGLLHLQYHLQRLLSFSYSIGF